jgi:hypothetical protein
LAKARPRPRLAPVTKAIDPATFMVDPCFAIDLAHNQRADFVLQIRF